MANHDYAPIHSQPQAAVCVPGVEPLSKPSESESPGAGEVVEGLETGFSALDQGMDLFKPSSATDGVKATSGTLSGLMSLIGGGIDAVEGVNDLHDGKSGKGAAELAKGAAGLVSGGAEAYGTALETFAGHGASEGAKKLFEDKAKHAGLVGSAASGVGDVIQGVTDVVDGRDKLRHGKNVDEKSGGLTTIVKGGAESLGGLAEGGMALTGTSSLGLDADLALAAGGGGACSVIAPAAASFATGLGIGNTMEGITKKSGLLKDERGHNENGSDRISRWGQQAAEWVDPSRVDAHGKTHLGGQSTLAQIAGGATTYLATPVGAALDAAGTIAAGAHKLWDWL